MQGTNGDTMRILYRYGFALLTAALAFAANSQGIAPTVCAPLSQPVHEEKFIPLGGSAQWVTIHGESCANPVILFLHGGPGNTLTPYADAIYGSWARDFTLVQWDQPGAGLTFGHNAPPADAALTLERMAHDGIALAQYLTQRLGKKKIILTGGSWGSVLGVQMVKLRPDLFSAYVGVSQIVSYRENLTASYAKVVEIARAKGDQPTLAAMQGIGPPPWANPRYFGALRRATRPYEAMASTPAPQSWWVRAPPYATPQRLAEYEEGEDYSYLQFVGLRGDGIFSKVDLPSLGSVFEVPVFLVHGSEDLVATPDVARRFFDGITAPQKEFVLVSHAGHDPNTALVDAQYRILRQRVLPLTQAQ